MRKTIVRRIVIIACVVLVVWGLGTALFDPGAIGSALIMTSVMAFFVVTALALAAVERPSPNQGLRYPGVLANVVAVSFPIYIWAKWLTGNLPLGGPAGLIPCLGFSFLAVVLLWVLEANTVFRPRRLFAAGVGLLTLLSFALSFAKPRPDLLANDYASELARLDLVANIAGGVYVVTAAAWLALLVTGARRANSIREKALVDSIEAPR